MKIYLVGGAVRDTLLGRPISDKDWVVVGATPEQMLAEGYQQVGADFPVFLHPDTHQEYALARTERKVKKGYTGFDCDASSTVTLEQDLGRRDLTINAMAMSDKGELIDPYHGQQDLRDKVLRHVSHAFIEDPLRVLRVARFAARLKGEGFRVADETLALMTEITKNGELEHLSGERVWKETARSLLEAHPEVYFEILHQCGALSIWFTELDQQWGEDIQQVLQQAVSLSSSLDVRFAALVHGLGNDITLAQHWPSDHQQIRQGLESVNRLCDRLKAPNDCRQLALITREFQAWVHHAFELSPADILNLFNRCDAWRRPQRFQDFLTSCQAQGREHSGKLPSPHADYIYKALHAAKAVNVKAIVTAGYQGPQIKQQLDQQRLRALALYREQNTMI